MKAIGSQAAVKQQTRYKFNAGTVLEDYFDVNYYETYFRQYDAQIGRFTGVDVLSEQTINLSGYQFSGNNPVSFNDPTGALINVKPKGQPENWNPNLRIEPRWLTDFWDNYWSDPFAAARAMGAANQSYENAQKVVDALNNAFTSDYGGLVLNDGTSYFYSSTDEAFSAGVAQMNASNSWGKYDGWATSAIDAQTRYNLSLIAGKDGGSGPWVGLEVFNIEQPKSWGKMYVFAMLTGQESRAEDGHAWIRLESNSGKVTTMSLWGNRGKQEFWINLEASWGSPIGSVYKESDITYQQYGMISQFNSVPGNINWTISNTCAGYSAALWNYVTGDNLSARTWYGTTTPYELYHSILKSYGLEH